MLEVCSTRDPGLLPTGRLESTDARAVLMSLPKDLACQLAPVGMPAPWRALASAQCGARRVESLYLSIFGLSVLLLLLIAGHHVGALRLWSCISRTGTPRSDQDRVLLEPSVERLRCQRSATTDPRYWVYQYSVAPILSRQRVEATSQGLQPMFWCPSVSYIRGYLWYQLRGDMLGVPILLE